MNPALSSADSTEVKEIGEMIKLPATEREMGRHGNGSESVWGERASAVLEFDLLLLFLLIFPESVIRSKIHLSERRCHRPEIYHFNAR